MSPDRDTFRFSPLAQAGEREEKKRPSLRSRLLLGLLALALLMGAVLAVILRQQAVTARADRTFHEVVAIETQLLTCRSMEGDFVVGGDQGSLPRLYAVLDTMVAQTREFAERTEGGMVGDRLQALQRTIVDYSATLKVLLAQEEIEGEYRDSAVLADLADTYATRCHELMNEVREAAFAEAAEASRQARQIIIFSVAAGLLLALVVGLWLIRRIVTPMESITSLADRVREGDIQDMDVQFRDMDMDAFTTRESYSMARAFQRLITRIRMSVSSELGLMDTYHMTMVVLIDRALGRIGRAIMEQARAQAGFQSIVEITPENIDRFIEALRDEAGERVDEERLEVLFQALKDLEE
ncbi:MAG: hypothetical protein R6W82_07750 [bacterium]